MWGGNIWHSSWPRESEGERVVCHISYTGKRMTQLLGREDSLYGPNGFEFDKRIQTFNNAKR